MHDNVAAEVTAVDYLAVTAAMPLFSSKDIRLLSGHQQPSLSGDDRVAQEERIGAW